MLCMSLSGCLVVLPDLRSGTGTGGTSLGCFVGVGTTGGVTVGSGVGVGLVTGAGA